MLALIGKRFVLIKSSIHFWSFAETNSVFSVLRYSVLIASAMGEDINERSPIKGFNTYNNLVTK